MTAPLQMAPGTTMIPPAEIVPSVTPYAGRPGVVGRDSGVTRYRSSIPNHPPRLRSVPSHAAIA